MHTLRNTNHKQHNVSRPDQTKLWDVVFMRPDGGVNVIIESVKWNEAAEWVNYLNGGTGQKFGELSVTTYHQEY